MDFAINYTILDTPNSDGRNSIVAVAEDMGCTPKYLAQVLSKTTLTTRQRAARCLAVTGGSASTKS
ncbi:hypothetical protein [Mesorhizobium amorphae]|uniref:hypothetical protein n=1 Tax=Mesorhizobium amorphae TaxID=71433 RepID=UPI00177EACC9|nr:hypothetical protein [Mesorhizobium amorphae]